MAPRLTLAAVKRNALKALDEGAIALGISVFCVGRHVATIRKEWAECDD